MFNTKTEYVNVETGEVLTDKKEIIKKFDKIKKHKKSEHNSYTGWTTITITWECEPKRQQQLFD